jgi:hypothetical protein
MMRETFERLWFGRALIAGALLLASQAEAAVPAVIAPSRSSPLPVQFSFPAKTTEAASASSLIRALTEALAANTDLVAVPLDDTVRSCTGDEACILRRAAESRAGRGPDLFLRIVQGPVAPGTDALSITVTDLSAVRRILEESHASREDLEVALARAEVATTQGRVRSASAAAEFLRRAVAETFRPALERSSHWNPPATVRVHSSVEAELELDGVPAGAVPVEFDVTQVRSSHRLRLSASGYDPREIELLPSVSEVRLDLRRELDVIRLSAGAAAVVGGLVLVGVALGHQPVQGCIQLRPGDVCPAPGSQFGTIPASAPFARQNTGTVLTAPLGYSLGAAGLAWAGSALLDRENAGWWYWLIGFGIGAVAYGLSAALGH